jgi:hypothetical protein
VVVLRFGGRLAALPPRASRGWRRSRGNSSKNDEGAVHGKELIVTIFFFSICVMSDMCVCGNLVLMKTMKLFAGGGDLSLRFFPNGLLFSLISSKTAGEEFFSAKIGPRTFHRLQVVRCESSQQPSKHMNTAGIFIVCLRSV